MCNETLTTRLIAYRFDTNNVDQKAAYRKMVRRLREQGLKMFETWGGKTTHYEIGKRLENHAIQLETKHVFGDQWNTAPIAGVSESGVRVHNWAQDAKQDCAKHIKAGYYLEITDAMRETVARRVRCGFCGHEANKADYPHEFCDRCLDSPHLKQDELRLLRMRGVDLARGTLGGERPPLTDNEAAELLPRYIERQTKGADSRDAQKLRKQREKIERDYETEATNAKNKRDGLIWLMDRGVSIDNVIYYAYTGKFCFGWRTPLSKEVEAELTNVLCAEGDCFPFDWTTKDA